MSFGVLVFHVEQCYEYLLIGILCGFSHWTNGLYKVGRNLAADKENYLDSALFPVTDPTPHCVHDNQHEQKNKVRVFLRKNSVSLSAGRDLVTKDSENNSFGSIEYEMEATGQWNTAKAMLKVFINSEQPYANASKRTKSSHFTHTHTLSASD